ncbi:MAG: hypothetical protein PHU54_08445 [Candidatus Omnitrophica bacterium]|nr:hypothetical protein [Candidatus Omnitrophota bacterium]
MKAYIAARYDRREEMCGYAQQLRELGHTVTSQWLLGTHQLHDNAHKVDNPEWYHPDEGITMDAAPFAMEDILDIDAADTLIFFSEPPDVYSKRGGRHVEYGIALALGIRLVVIGPRENVFHCLPQVERYDNWDEYVGC